MELYYTFLKNRIEKHPGSVEGHILYLPEIYKLLSLLATEAPLSKEEPVDSVIQFCLEKTEADMGILAPQVLDFCGLKRHQVL